MTIGLGFIRQKSHKQSRKPEKPKVQIPSKPAQSLQPPPQLSTRNLRTSVLLSGFSLDDFDQFGSGTTDTEVVQMVQVPADRPNRSSIRPSSWMLMNDGHYAPPQKVQRPHHHRFGDEKNPNVSIYDQAVPKPNIDFRNVLADYHSVQPSAARSTSRAEGPAPLSPSTSLAVPQPSTASQPDKQLSPRVAPTANIERPKLPSQFASPNLSTIGSYSPLAAFLGTPTTTTTPFVPSIRKQSVPSSQTQPTAFINRPTQPSRVEHTQIGPTPLISCPTEPSSPIKINPERLPPVSTDRTREPSASRARSLADPAQDTRQQNSTEPARINSSTTVKNELNPAGRIEQPLQSTDLEPLTSPPPPSLSSREPLSALKLKLDVERPDPKMNHLISKLSSWVDPREKPLDRVSTSPSITLSVLPEPRKSRGTQLTSPNQYQPPIASPVTQSQSPSASSGSGVQPLSSAKPSVTQPNDHSQPDAHSARLPSSQKRPVRDVYASESSEESVSDGERAPESTFSSPRTEGSTTTTVDDQPPTEPKPIINLDQLLLRSTHRIFVRILADLPYLDFFSLTLVSAQYRDAFESDAFRELVLERYLGPLGYHRRSSSSPITPTITLRDLQAFYIGLEFGDEELATIAREHVRQRGAVDQATLRMVREATRAHNRILIHIRANGGVGQGGIVHLGHRLQSIWKAGRAVVLKVWVPCNQSWMSNEEVVECEREMWRSQVWPQLRRGDVCWNCAVGEFANEGKLIFDGKFLRDLSFDFDPVGSLPVWLNMFSFPPGYYHNVIAASTSSPIFYLDLSAFGREVQANLKLCQDKVEVCSPQARYRVQRWVYRAVVVIQPGMVTGPRRVGVAETVDLNWVGSVVIEVEGTSEHARELLKRCSKEWSIEVEKKLSSGQSGPSQIHLTPWKIVREKCGPGKMWIRPVYDEEKL